MALKHVDPMKKHGPLWRGYVAVLRTPPGRWFGINVAARLDPWLLRRTNGRVGMAAPLPSALLESTGAKSGAERVCPVVYYHDGQDVILIASSFGRDKDPAWSHNLRAHPECRLGGETFDVALVEDAEERERLWGLASRVYPGYADYRERCDAIGRRIPIFRLSAA